MTRKHFINKTLNSTTHNQNPIYLKKFLHRLPWLPTVTSSNLSSPLPLFQNPKTHLSLSLQNHHSLTSNPHKPINLLLCFFFFSHRRPWLPHPEISLPSLSSSFLKPTNPSLSLPKPSFPLKSNQFPCFVLQNPWNTEKLRTLNKKKLGVGKMVKFLSGLQRPKK